MPASYSASDIGEFLNFGYYRNSWVSETVSPRAEGMTTSPPDRVQVWMNSTLVASLRAGRDGLKDPATGMAHPPPDKGSMAIKELWQETATHISRVGSAAIWKIADGDAPKSWAYYCNGPPSRCGSNDGSYTVYGLGTSVSCGSCHGGLIFTKAP